MIIYSKKYIIIFIVSIFLLLEPILSIYGWINLSFATIFSYIVVVFYLIYGIGLNQIKNKFPKYLSLYFVWLFICNYLSFGKIIPMGDIFQYLLFLSVFTLLQFDILMNLYRKLAYLFIIFFVIQELSFFLIGVRFIGIFESLPICFGGDNFDLEHYLTSLEEGIRSSSFFSEPAHFAQFLLPLLVIDIFRINNLRSALFPSLIIIVLLLLRSGNALLGLSVILIAYFFSLVISQNSNKIMLVLLFVVALGGIFYYVQSDLGESVLERKDTISGELDVTSGFLRVYRGYYIYNEYSFFEKLVGINNVSIIKEKIKMSDIYWTFLDENDIYFNCVQNILLRTGLVGLFIFSLFCYSLWRNNCTEGKVILLVFVALSFVASLYLSSVMILYLYLSYNLKDAINYD